MSNAYRTHYMSMANRLPTTNTNISCSSNSIISPIAICRPRLMTCSRRSSLINSHLFHIRTDRCVVSRASWTIDWVHLVVVAVGMNLIVLDYTFVIQELGTAVSSRLRHLRFVSLTEGAYCFCTNLVLLLGRLLFVHWSMMRICMVSCRTIRSVLLFNTQSIWRNLISSY